MGCEVFLIEYVVLLFDYDCKCVFYNEFCGEGDFELGYFFVVEFLLDLLIVG